MKFHLNFIPKKSDFKINHQNKLFLIGSCFSESIGKNLVEYYFKTYANPNGIQFNPLSIANCLFDIVENKAINENLILNRDTLFLSYHHHSSINSNNKATLIEKINLETKKAHLFLKESNYLIITFGTAFFYQHLQLNQPVANCHKQVPSTFEKNLLTVNEIVSNYTHLVKKIQQFNADLKIIFTISPVNYLKDGVIENNLSKSILTLAIHDIIKQHANCSYFPSYELVNDDLRDYRFYKEDLAHPNELAVNYVWEKFAETYFAEKTIAINKQINKLNIAINHRKITSENIEAKKLDLFIKNQQEEIKKLDPTILAL